MTYDVLAGIDNWIKSHIWGNNLITVQTSINLMVFHSKIVSHCGSQLIIDTSRDHLIIKLDKKTLALAIDRVDGFTGQLPGFNVFEADLNHPDSTIRLFSEIFHLVRNL